MNTVKSLTTCSEKCPGDGNRITRSLPWTAPDGGRHCRNVSARSVAHKPSTIEGTLAAEVSDCHTLSRKDPKSSARSELGVVLFYLGVLLALVVALLAEGLFRLIALAALGVFGLYFLLGDFFLAISDERASKRFPHDNYHSDVGRTVKVLDDFVLESGTGKGKVLLAGECWNARAADGKLYKAGAKLKVLRVEGLELVVTPSELR